MLKVYIFLIHKENIPRLDMMIYLSKISSNDNYIRSKNKILPGKTCFFPAFPLSHTKAVYSDKPLNNVPLFPPLSRTFPRAKSHH